MSQITLSTEQGMFKKVFADKMEQLVPEFSILGERIPFIPTNKRPGELYSQPVVVSMENGVTYLGDAGAVGTLSTPSNHLVRDAQVKGSEVNVRSQVGYKALSSASSAGERAFVTQMQALVTQMTRTVHKRLEIARLYGQVGIGTVSSFATSTVTLTAASWAAGIWAGMVGASVQVYQGTDLSTVRAVDLVIGSVNPSNRTIVFSNGTITTAPVLNDVLFFASAKPTGSGGNFNEMAGLQKILTNSGTLFNVSASTYDLWRGNQNSTAGNLTFDRIQTDCMNAMGRGLMEKVLVLVSPAGWASLNSDQAALRVLDSSYSSDKSKNGSKSLEFYAATGIIEIVAHPFVKDGDYFIVPPEYLVRIGSTEPTFDMPGKPGTPLMVLVANSNAVEFQCMADEQIFLEMPAHGVYGSGVTNT
jgi:hypothetical protein